MPTRTSPEPAFDRFTLPGQIPDSTPVSPPRGGGAGGGGPASPDDARPRGRAPHPNPSPDGAGPGADPAAAGYTASHPAGRGWIPQSRDLGLPPEHDSAPLPPAGGAGVPADGAGAIGHGQVFTRERRVRFLDHLAFHGNVRAAAARVAVSHETAYRARRQDAAFAALWDAALVHARHYAESQLATRALDGVAVPVAYHGEVTYVVRHDPRLLLAHLGRLDRRVESDAAALARAGRFDELLAGYAGHDAPAGFAEAAAEARDWRERATAPALPPTRAEWVAWRRGEAMDAPGRGKGAKAEARSMAAAGAAAGAEWDGWHGGALARVGALVNGEAGGAPAAAPAQPAGAAGPAAEPRNSAAADRVTPVNPGRGARARRLQLHCGAAVGSPYSAPVIA